MPPRVRRVVEEMSRRISQGRLRPGDQLPTLRELCRAFEVSYGVIHQALQRLELDGLVHKLHGSGTYVKERRASKAAGAAGGPRLPAQSRSDVYILMHAMRAEFFTPLASLVCAMQDRGLVPIPVMFDRFQPASVERLIGLWHENPPRAVLVRGATREVAETVQKHSPAVTRFIVVYNLADGTSPQWHSVHPDEFESHRLAAQHLIARGHRHIGLPVNVYEGLMAAAVQTFLLSKAGGIRKALSEAGLPDAALSVHEKRVPRSDASGIGMTTDIVLEMARWLRGNGETSAPTAIIESTHRMPCVLAAAREAGLQPGAGFDVIGIGDAAPARQGEYACVDDRFDAIAREVTEMILSDSDDFDRVGRHVVVAPMFVPRWEPSKEMPRARIVM